MPGGPKLVHLTFNMDEGPKVKIRNIEFVGNKAVSDGALKRQMKENKERPAFEDAAICVWFMSVTGAGTYQETKFDEDAERVVEYYRDHGYIKAHVGEPELKVLEDSKDKKTRWVELRIPVTEGQRYQVGNFDFAGNTVVKTDALGRSSRSGPASTTARRRSARASRRRRKSTAPAATSSSPAIPTSSPATNRAAAEPEAPAALAAVDPPKREAAAPPIVDVTMRMQEGQAVLRQPHHLRRQHDDARQRHPARDAAVRERRLQHRGAEVQHQAAQSARLLQAARGRQGRQRRQDAERDEQGRRQAEARGAEPQPAHVRRRRLAVRRASSASCRSRPRISSAAARASRCRCRADRARRTTRWRSPSRSSSIATSPAASTCSGATSATSASSRSSRPAAC